MSVKLGVKCEYKVNLPILIIDNSVNVYHYCFPLAPAPYCYAMVMKMYCLVTVSMYIICRSVSIIIRLEAFILIEADNI